MSTEAVVKEKKVSASDTSDRIILASSAAALLLVLFFLFFADSVSIKGNYRPVGTIETTVFIRRRHANSLRWSSLEGRETIYLRDVVYVPKDSHATVSIKGKAPVELPPDTLVQFDEFALDNINITLLDLVFRLDPPPKVRVSNLLPDIYPLELRLSEVSGRMYDLLYRASRLQALQQIGPLPSSQLDRLSDYQLILLSPRPNIYNWKAFRWMSVKWAPIPLDGVQYEMNLSQDIDFRNRFPYNSDKRKLMVRIDKEGTYHWKVMARRKDEAIHSEVWKFNITKEGGISVSDETVRSLAGGAGPTAEVSKDRGFKQIVLQGPLEKNKCPQEGLPPGEYFCRVRSPDKKVLKTIRFKVGD